MYGITAVGLNGIGPGVVGVLFWGLGAGISNAHGG